MPAVGSPAVSSREARRVVPVVLTAAPLSLIRSAKSSFAGRPNTVNVAAALVTLPPPLLTTTSYPPAWSARTLGSVSVVLVALASAAPLKRHW